MEIRIEIQYLPPISFFARFFLADRILIDDLEPFGKQSYRNRCYIAGANGKLPLIIPVHDSRRRLPVRDVLIDNHIPWQRTHWQAIRSAYGKTPFFLHYEHYFRPFYESDKQKLFDFDLAFLRTCMKLLKIPSEKLALLSETGSFQGEDARNIIHPKRDFQEDGQFHSVQYMQAFAERYGFLPNLSIIDLLFNEGPRALEILKECAGINN